MEVKPKSRVTIIPVGSNPNTTNNDSGPTPNSTPNPNPSPITIGGGNKITIGGNRPSIGGPRPSIGGGGGFQPRPAFRGPRRDLTKFNTDEHRINERIRVPQVRLIDHEGNQVGVVGTPEALQMAKDAGFDLVEISPNATPPVCKILDYGKFKYEKKKKDHEAKKKQVVVKVKEVQLRPNTDEHDLAYKFKNVRTFLEEGDKAKITMMFRGREVAYVESGHKTMRRLIEELGEMAIVEAPPKLEGKKLIMVIGPNPKYKPKKPEKAATEKAEKPAKSDKDEA
ncbi:MAG: translation initiation factor IF-3 [Bdellovibrionales bacterium]|nr:translation initiation factor IF-3 [Bdellovibrionales bacterium]